MVLSRRSLSTVIFGAAALVAVPATAQSVRVLGEHNAWSAYATTESSGQICFVISRPTSADPAQYDAAYFYISHRPSEGVEGEINIVTGYQFAPDTAATLSVDGQSFELFTQEDAAWLADRGQSTAARQAIRAGATMTVQGTAMGGESVSQTFSLSGSTAATDQIDSAC